MVLLGALPAVTGALVAYLLWPSPPATAPLRLALARAGVLVGGLAGISVEALSAFRALAAPAVVALWTLATLVAVAAVVRRVRSGLPRTDLRARLRGHWQRAGRVERILGAALAGLLLAELVIALRSPPNNFDSQTYHLPRIEHWVVQRDLAFYPSSIVRQLAMTPGAEYLLLHLRLLTGGDQLYNLVQWCAGVGGLLLASRIAAQFGGAPRAQLLTAFLVGTTPLVGLEATSTQTDLVLAAWVAALATLVLDELRRRTPAGNLGLLGAVAGMTALTKANGLLAVGPLLLVWFIAQVRQGFPRALGAGLAVTALAALVCGPFFYRVDEVYHNPLGPDYLRDSISMTRHDPPAVLVNALRIGQTALQTPVAALNNAAASGIERLSRSIGVNPDDPSITYDDSTFPSLAWPPDEDRVSFPVQGTLILLGAGFVLVRPGRRVPPGQIVAVRAYAAVFFAVVLGYVDTVKWQPWGNRLILFVLVLGAPLAGLWLDAVLDRRPALGAASALSRSHSPQSQPQPQPQPQPRPRPRLGQRIAALSAVVSLLAGGGAGWLAVSYGWPRRLVGSGSVFTEGDVQARFQRRPGWQAGYTWAAAAVRASGAHRVGLVQGYNTWEYPWWVLLPEDDIVSLRSLKPGIPPPRPDTMDAIVCVSSTALCQRYTPRGWTMSMRDGIGYALPG
jgi:hypothetical protein